MTKYSRLGASSRLRTLQYLPLMEGGNFKCVVQSLFDDDYLLRLYRTGQRSRAAILRCYFKRIWALLASWRFDLLWIEKELLPYMPAYFERVLFLVGKRYVVDYDDAIFHNYDLSSNKLVRFFLARKIDVVMRRATCVVAGNEYLAERAWRACAERVEHIPTVVDLARYSPAISGPPISSCTIGWIGSPSTQKYILALRAVFESLYQTHAIRLVLVGARPEVAQQFGSVPVDVLPWAEDTETHHVASFDIGIMPLPNNPWERGKCGYKLIQYMACAKPVVASPVGVNTEIVQGWNCGLLAESDDQWFGALDRLLRMLDARAEFGRRGRLAVESHYSLQAQAPKLAGILRDAAGKVG